MTAADPSATAPAVGVLNDVACELGEGPAAHAGRGLLFWFDIRGKRLFERRFEGGGVTIHDMPVVASVAATIDGDRQLVGTERGLYVRTIATNGFTLHTPILENDPTTRSNDGRTHPSGALWIGTMGWEPARERGAIWWFRAGELRKLYDGIAIPNGICFAPDGSHGFFTDSTTGVIRRVEIDPATGLPTGEPKTFATVTDGSPDGAVVDADGLLLGARWGGAALDVYDPSGRRIRSVPLPARQSSCPVFFGAAADRLAVTSAWEGMDPAARAADPFAGQTFEVHMPVRGRIDPPVLL